MPSPFPGMDPYLENPSIWSDFHGTFLVCLRAELNRLLPKGFVARWDRYVWVDDPDCDSLQVLGQPDVFVSDLVGGESPAPAGTILAAPATITLPVLDPKGKPFVKIIDVQKRRVVTVVEMLSPANKKAGKDRDAYLAKRQEYLRAKTNLVELDFLRTGLRPPVEGGRPPGDYYVIVSRVEDYPRAAIWPLTVRDSIPPLPIPLVPELEPVWMAIWPSMAQAYQDARLDDDIDYSQPPIPSLSEPDATWARELIDSKKTGA
jgi:hypothetical protein